MTRIEFWEPSPDDEIPGKGIFRTKFAPAAFANAAGKRVPFRSRPGGPQIGWVTVISVVVDEDGYGATWTVDADLDLHPGDIPTGRNRPPASFSFRPRGADDGPVLRDPLAARPPVVRWRDGRE